MYKAFNYNKKLCNKNFSLFFTKDDDLLNDYYTIREKCYRKVKNGPQNFDGREDLYDRLSDILVVTYRDIVVGGVRIFGNLSCDHIPLETKDFRLKKLLPEFDLENNNYCEFGRLSLLDSFRNHDMLDNIVEDLVTFSIAKGYKYLFFISPLVQARCYQQSLQRIGFYGAFKIYRDLKMIDKTEDECGGLDMFLSSVEFPPTWNGIQNRKKLKAIA